MATQAQTLAQASRTAQLRLADVVARQVRALWGQTVQGPGRGTDQLLEATVPLIGARHAFSARQGATSYRLARRLALPGEPAFEMDLPTLVDEALIASIVATGFKTLSDQLAAGAPLPDALLAGQTAFEGTAVRHTLSGGRQYVIDATGVDRLAVGYYRVVRPGCCSFCAMLASRGPVYAKDSFDESDPRFVGEHEVKVHDHCRCMMAPTFDKGDRGLPLNLELEQLWQKEIAKQFFGIEARRKWRSIYEARYLRGAVSSGVAS